MEIKLDKMSLFETSGFSMWPFLKEGSKLIIKNVSVLSLKVGDIILYRANNQQICHRLIKKIKNKGGYLLYIRGDNSLSSPEIINEDAYLGKVIGVLKNGKIVTFRGIRPYLINRVIVLIAPLISLGIRIIKSKKYHEYFKK
jgi:signal peptidase I